MNTFKYSTRLLAGLAVLSIAMLAGGVAVADEPQKAVVSFGDLDLSRDVGVATLYRRIEFAADKVCVAYEGKAIGKHVLHHNCIQDATNRAIADINVPALTSYHAARTGARKDERVAAR